MFKISEYIGELFPWLFWYLCYCSKPISFVFLYSPTPTGLGVRGRSSSLFKRLLSVPPLMAWLRVWVQVAQRDDSVPRTWNVVCTEKKSWSAIRGSYLSWLVNAVIPNCFVAKNTRYFFIDILNSYASYLNLKPALHLSIPWVKLLVTLKMVLMVTNATMVTYATMVTCATKPSYGSAGMSCLEDRG